MLASCTSQVWYWYLLFLRLGIICFYFPGLLLTSSISQAWYWHLLFPRVGIATFYLTGLVLMPLIFEAWYWHRLFFRLGIGVFYFPGLVLTYVYQVWYLLFYILYHLFLGILSLANFDWHISFVSLISGMFYLTAVISICWACSNLTVCLSLLPGPDCVFIFPQDLIVCFHLSP